MLTLVLALVLSYDLAVSATAVSVTFGLVLAAQHVIRWLMRHRLAEIPFQQAAVWITLAAQTALPLGYLAAAPGRRRPLGHPAARGPAAGLRGGGQPGVCGPWGGLPDRLCRRVRRLWRWGRSVQFAGGSPAGGLLDQPVLSHDGVVAVLLMLVAGRHRRRPAVPAERAGRRRTLALAGSVRRLRRHRPVPGAARR